MGCRRSSVIQNWVYAVKDVCSGHPEHLMRVSVSSRIDDRLRYLRMDVALTLVHVGWVVRSRLIQVASVLRLTAQLLAMGAKIREVKEPALVFHSCGFWSGLCSRGSRARPFGLDWLLKEGL